MFANISDKMKQAVLTSLHNIEINECDKPQITKSDDVLIEVKSVGICGSDIHYYRQGRIGNQTIHYPFRAGHEFSGRIIAVGTDVSNLSVGDRVAVDPLVWCGKCSECLNGRYHTCLNQKFTGAPGQLEGALAEFITIPAKCCFKIPDSLTYNQAVLIEPFSIALHAAGFMDYNYVDSILILGVGPIGLSVLLVAQVHGIKKLFVTDLIDSRLEKAKELGASYTGNPNNTNIVDDIKSMKPDGLPVVFDCCGKQSALDQSIALLRPGGKLILVGIQEFDEISFNPHDIRRKEITIQTVRRQNEKMLEAIELINSRKILSDFLITHEFPFPKTKEAFDLVENYKDGVLKAVVTI